MERRKGKEEGGVEGEERDHHIITVQVCECRCVSVGV